MLSRRVSGDLLKMNIIVILNTLLNLNFMPTLAKQSFDYPYLGGTVA
jgi:hypothetical protein